MLAFAFGVTLTLLVIMAAKGRRYRHCHSGRGRGPFGRISERLGLDPDQRKSVETELRQLFEEARGTSKEFKKSLLELATLFGEAEIDPERLAGVWTSQDEALRELRGKITEALNRVHATLNPTQRRRLGELVTGFDRRFACGTC